MVLCSTGARSSLRLMRAACSCASRSACLSSSRCSSSCGMRCVASRMVLALSSLRGASALGHRAWASQGCCAPPLWARRCTTASRRCALCKSVRRGAACSGHTACADSTQRSLTTGRLLHGMDPESRLSVHWCAAGDSSHSPLCGSAEAVASAGSSSSSVSLSCSRRTFIGRSRSCRYAPQHAMRCWALAQGARVKGMS